MGFIQKSKVRGLVKGAGMNLGSDVFVAVDGVVEAAVAKAVEAAKAAGRKTVRACDFAVMLGGPNPLPGSKV